MIREMKGMKGIRSRVYDDGDEREGVEVDEQTRRKLLFFQKAHSSGHAVQLRCAEKGRECCAVSVTPVLKGHREEQISIQSH